MYDLKNKVALVTGSGSGIGRAIALSFAKAGAAVGIADINLEGAQQTLDQIVQLGGRGLVIEMDVTNEDAVNTGVDALHAKFGHLDVLVSNAGIQVIHKIEELSFSDWKKMLAIHLDGAFLTTKAALKYMYQQESGGKVIYMGSAHSHAASLYKAPYVTAKHGLLGLARTLAKEGGTKNVHSHVICPGFVKTPLVEKQIPQQAKKKGITEEEVVNNIMLGETVDHQFTTIEDIATLATFLASYPNGVFTGQSILASHGWIMG